MVLYSTQHDLFAKSLPYIRTYICGSDCLYKIKVGHAVLLRNITKFVKVNKYSIYGTVTNVDTITNS